LGCQSCHSPWRIEDATTVTAWKGPGGQTVDAHIPACIVVVACYSNVEHTLFFEVCVCVGGGGTFTLTQVGQPCYYIHNPLVMMWRSIVA
jgi:hypothetical protein